MRPRDKPHICAHHRVSNVICGCNWNGKFVCYYCRGELGEIYPGQLFCWSCVRTELALKHQPDIS